MKYAAIFAAVAATTLMLFMYCEYLDSSANALNLEARLQQTYKTLDEAKDDAYGDCQVMRNNDRRMYVMDGCAMAVDQICHERVRPNDREACLRDFIRVCDKLTE